MRLRADVSSLVNADVSSYVVDVACAVRGCARRVRHRHNTAEVGDTLGISINIIEASPHAREKLVEENLLLRRSSQEDVTTRNRHGIDIIGDLAVNCYAAA